jgi:hypothetical protein
MIPKSGFRFSEKIMRKECMFRRIGHRIADKNMRQA